MLFHCRESHATVQKVAIVQKPCRTFLDINESWSDGCIHDLLFSFHTMHLSQCLFLSLLITHTGLHGACTVSILCCFVACLMIFCDFLFLTLNNDNRGSHPAARFPFFRLQSSACLLCARCRTMYSSNLTETHDSCLPLTVSVSCSLTAKCETESATECSQRASSWCFNCRCYFSKGWMSRLDEHGEVNANLWSRSSHICHFLF